MLFMRHLSDYRPKSEKKPMLTFCWILLLLVSEAEFSLLGCLHKEFEKHYRAINNKEMVLQCPLPSQSYTHVFNNSLTYKKKVVWFRQQKEGELLEVIGKESTNPTQEGNALWFKPIRNNDSGIYICKIREEASCFKIIIEVQAKSQARCLDYETNTLSLIAGKGDSISCPGLKCYGHLNRSQVTWYKNGTLLTEKTFRQSLKLKGDKINLLTIYDKDAGVYVCDYMLFVNNTRWTMRTVVKVNVIAPNTIYAPKMLSPKGVKILEAELGKPIEMQCKVQFGYERDVIPMITWSRHSQEGKSEELEQKQIRDEKNELVGETVIHIASLREVTERDLNSNFTCIAQNSVGKSTGVIKLKRKERVHFLYILSGLISMLLGLLVSSAFIYQHWIEIVLMYRNYLVKDETIGDHKEFDAFVSHAKMGSFESDSSFVNEEQFALDVLPEVLEKKHGYKLCLLERDILPGGAYTDDVVTAIKQSRRTIIILSPSYVNGPSIFELQAAVNCALEDSTIKLVLIKFQAFQEPDYLPPVVKKALRILPVITWKSSNWTTPNKKFWKNIQYYMPVKNTEGLGKKQTKGFLQRLFSMDY